MYLIVYLSDGINDIFHINIDKSGLHMQYKKKKLNKYTEVVIINSLSLLMRTISFLSK